MPLFTIGPEDRIRAVDKTELTENIDGSFRFTSEKELEQVAEQWPATRLVTIFNALAGVAPTRKFTSRQIAIARIWKAIQGLPAMGMKSGLTQRSEITFTKPGKKAENQVSKKDEVVALLSTGTEVTLAELMVATGWQKHTVRGFLSILKTRMGLKIASSRNAASERVYRVSR